MNPTQHSKSLETDKNTKKSGGLNLSPHTCPLKLRIPSWFGEPCLILVVRKERDSGHLGDGWHGDVLRSAQRKVQFSSE